MDSILIFTESEILMLWQSQFLRQFRFKALMEEKWAMLAASWYFSLFSNDNHERITINVFRIRILRIHRDHPRQPSSLVYFASYLFRAIASFHELEGACFVASASPRPMMSDRLLRSSNALPSLWGCSWFSCPWRALKPCSHLHEYRTPPESAHSHRFQ